MTDKEKINTLRSALETISILTRRGSTIPQKAQLSRVRVIAGDALTLTDAGLCENNARG